VHFNRCIEEFGGYQSRHQLDSISYIPIESIDHYRDDSSAYRSPKVVSPAIPLLALLQRCSRISSDECNRIRTMYPTQATIAHPSAPVIIFLSAVRSSPTEDQGGITRYARFTSSDATDGSSNRDYLLQDSMELSTLQMMLGVYCRGYRSLTKLCTSSR